MVINRIKKYNIAGILGVVFLLVVFSCEDSFQSVDCSDCYIEKPEYGQLKIKVTLTGKHQRVPLVIYKNKYEDQVIEWKDTATTNEYTLDVPVNNYYSVEAKYTVNGKTVLVVDGDYIETSLDKESCDNECYIIKGGIIHVELKYDDLK